MAIATFYSLADAIAIGGAPSPGLVSVCDKPHLLDFARWLGGTAMGRALLRDSAKPSCGEANTRGNA